MRYYFQVMIIGFFGLWIVEHVSKEIKQISSNGRCVYSLQGELQVFRVGNTRISRQQVVFMLQNPYKQTEIFQMLPNVRGLQIGSTL